MTVNTGGAEQVEIESLQARVKELEEEIRFLHNPHSGEECNCEICIPPEPSETCKHEWVKLDNPKVHNHTGTFCSKCKIIYKEQDNDSRS